MKKLKDWLGLIIGAIFGVIAGFLIAQPKVNKLKKQVASLQKNNAQLLARCDYLQNEFRELLVQHKALKVLQLKKKTESKGRIHENLMMQYAIRDYLELLLKRVKDGKKLSGEEKVFFKAFEGVIEGTALSTDDKARIKEYVMAQHSAEIHALRECDYTATLQALNECRF